MDILLVDQRAKIPDENSISSAELHKLNDIYLIPSELRIRNINLNDNYCLINEKIIVLTI